MTTPGGNMVVVLTNSEMFGTLCHSALLGLGFRTYFLTQAHLEESKKVLYDVHRVVQPLCYIVDTESIALEEIYVPIKEFCAAEHSVSLYGKRSADRANYLASYGKPKLVIYSQSRYAKDLFPFAESVISGKLSDESIAEGVYTIHQKTLYDMVYTCNVRKRKTKSFLLWSLPVFLN